MTSRPQKPSRSPEGTRRTPSPTSANLNRSGAVRKPARARVGRNHRPEGLNIGQQSDSQAAALREQVDRDENEANQPIHTGAAESLDYLVPYIEGLARISLAELGASENLEDTHNERLRRAGNDDSPRVENYADVQRHLRAQFPAPPPEAQSSEAPLTPDSPRAIEQRRLRNIEFDQLLMLDTKFHRNMMTILGIKEWWVKNGNQWRHQVIILTGIEVSLSQPDVTISDKQRYQKKQKDLQDWFHRNRGLQRMVLSHLKALEEEERRNTSEPDQSYPPPNFFAEFRYITVPDVKQARWYRTHGFEWFLRCAMWDLEEKSRELTELSKSSEKLHDGYSKLHNSLRGRYDEEDAQSRTILEKIENTMKPLRGTTKRSRDGLSIDDLRAARADEKERHASTYRELERLRQEYNYGCDMHKMKRYDFAHQAARAKKVEELIHIVYRNQEVPVALLSTEFLNFFHRFLCRYDRAHRVIKQLHKIIEDDDYIRDKRVEMQELYAPAALAGEYDSKMDIDRRNIYKVDTWKTFDSNYFDDWFAAVEQCDTKVRAALNRPIPELHLVSDHGSIGSGLRAPYEEPAPQQEDPRDAPLPAIPNSQFPTRVYEHRHPRGELLPNAWGIVDKILEGRVRYNHGDHETDWLPLGEDIRRTIGSPDLAFRFKDLNRRREPLNNFVGRLNSYLNSKVPYSERIIQAFVMECTRQNRLFEFSHGEVSAIEDGWDFVAENPVTGCPRAVYRTAEQEGFPQVIAWFVKHHKEPEFTTAERKMTLRDLYRTINIIQQRDWANGINDEAIKYLDNDRGYYRFLDYCSERGLLWGYTWPRIITEDTNYEIVRLDNGWQLPKQEFNLVPLLPKNKPKSWSYLRQMIATKDLQRQLSIPQVSRTLVRERDYYEFFYSRFKKDNYILSTYEFYHFLRWCTTIDELFRIRRDGRVDKIDKGWPVSKAWYKF
ncbi:hypothetical protein PVAG01_00714 [Phlyctema vagabunda]|uniref:Uncharacterized protein n=1 Tax=Phlyctema vagabunda TaxID=108571 RepID=A0ABR4PVE1_9HELO